MPFDSLTITVQDHIATIELSRPEVHNRFDSLLHEEFARALHTAADDAEVRVAIVCSTGKYFTAGGDSGLMLEAQADFARRMALVDEGRRLYHAVADFPKPLIVALEGDSHGVGSTVVMSADAVVAHDGVRIIDAHVQFAVTAGDGGIIAWPMNMPFVLAKRHLLTGEPLTAEVAHRLGIITDLAPTAATVRPTAQSLAEQMAALPPMAVQMTKRALNAIATHRMAEGLDVGFYLEAMTLGSDDLGEAIEAFRDRRPGRWTGS